MKNKRKGFVLIIVLISLIAVAAVIPLLINSTESANERIFNADKWNKIKWLIKGHQFAYQDYKKSKEISLPLRFDYVATFSYNSDLVVNVRVNEFSSFDKKNYGYFLGADIYKGNSAPYTKVNYDLSYFKDESWVYPSVFAYGSSSALLYPDGSLYSFGSNAFGHAGIGINDDNIYDATKLTKDVSNEELDKIWQVSLGNSNSSFIDLNGDYYELGGFVWSEKTNRPRKTELSFKPIYAACGENYYAILGKDEKVYRKSKNTKFSNNEIDVYSSISGLANAKGLFAGKNNLFAVDSNGDLYGCGNNASFTMGVVEASSLENGIADNFVKIKNYLNLVEIKACDYNTEEKAYATVDTTTLNLTESYETAYLTLYMYFANDSDASKTVATYTESGNIIFADYFVTLKNMANDTEKSFFEYDLIKIKDKFYACRFICKNLTAANYEITLGRYAAYEDNWNIIHNYNREGKSELDSAETLFYTPLPDKEVGRKNVWASKTENGAGLFRFDGVNSEINEFKFVCVAVGDGFAYFLTKKEGVEALQLYSVGTNKLGELGLGLGFYSFVTSLVPVKLENAAVGEYPVYVVAGGHHALVLTNKNRVFSTGDNSKRQLGRLNMAYGSNFKPITEGLSGKKIISIAAGYKHSIAMDSDGKVYTWGDNSCGQLGRSGDSTKAAVITVNNL